MFAKLKRMSSEIDTVNINNRTADFIRIATEIHSITECYFFKKPTVAEVQLIKALETKITPIKNPQDFAVSQFKAGNYDGFMTVYQVFTDNQKNILVMKIFDYLKDQKSDTSAAAESERAILIIYLKTLLHIVLGSLLENSIFRYYASDKCFIAFLVHVGMKGNFKTFEMLLTWIKSQ